MIPFVKPRSQKSPLELAIDGFRNALIEMGYKFEPALRLAKLYSSFKDFIYLNPYLLAIVIDIIKDNGGDINTKKIKTMRLGKYNDTLAARVVTTEKINFDRVRLDIIRYIIKIWKYRNPRPLNVLLNKDKFKFVVGISY